MQSNAHDVKRVVLQGFGAPLWGADTGLDLTLGTCPMLERSQPEVRDCSAVNTASVTTSPSSRTRKHVLYAHPWNSVDVFVAQATKPCSFEYYIVLKHDKIFE